MHKFKVADKVKVIDHSGNQQARIGDIGIVVEISNGDRGELLRVKVIGRNAEYKMYAFRFEFIEEYKKVVKVYGIAKFMEAVCERP